MSAAKQRTVVAVGKTDIISRLNVLEATLRHIAGPSWRATTTHSPRTDGFEINLRPAVYGLVELSGLDIARTAGDRYRIVDLLMGRINTLRGTLMDELDKSLGRPARVDDKPPPGCCKFCGAPYGTAP